MDKELEIMASVKAEIYRDTVLATYNNRYKEAGYKDYKQGFIDGASFREQPLREDLERFINDFVVGKELKHEIACLVTAYMATVGIDVSDEQQQQFQDKHSGDLIDSVLDTLLVSLAARTALAGEGLSQEEIKAIQEMADNDYSDMNAMEFGEWIAANDFIVIGPLKKNWGAKDSWNKFLGYHSCVSTQELYQIFKKHEREEFQKRVETTPKQLK